MARMRRSTSSSFSLPSNGSIDIDADCSTSFDADAGKLNTLQQPAQPVNLALRQPIARHTTDSFRSCDGSLDGISLDGSIDIDVAVANYEVLVSQQPQQRTSAPPASTSGSRSTGVLPRPPGLASLTAEPPPLVHRSPAKQRPDKATEDHKSLMELGTSSSPNTRVSPLVSPRPAAPTTPAAASTARLSHPGNWGNGTATAAATTAAHLLASPTTGPPAPLRLPPSPVKGGAHTPTSPSPKSMGGPGLPTRKGAKPTTPSPPPAKGNTTPTGKQNGLNKALSGLPQVHDDPHEKDRVSPPSMLNRTTPGGSVNSPTARGSGPGMLSPSTMANRGAAHSNPLSPSIQSKKPLLPTAAPTMIKALPNGSTSPLMTQTGKKPLTPVSGAAGGITLPTANELATAKKVDLGAARTPFSSVQEPMSLDKASDLNRSTNKLPNAGGFALVAYQGAPQLAALAAANPTTTDSVRRRESSYGESMAVAKLRTPGSTPPRTRSSRPNGPQLLPELMAQRSDAGTMLIAREAAETLGLSQVPASQQLTQSASMRASTPGRIERPSYVQWSFRSREPRASQTGQADPDLAHLSFTGAE